MAKHGPYNNLTPGSNHSISFLLIHNTDKNKVTVEASDTEEEAPQISLQEMLDDLHLNDDDGEQGQQLYSRINIVFHVSDCGIRIIVIFHPSGVEQATKRCFKLLQ